MSQNATISTETQPDTTQLSGRISSIIETARNRVRTVVDTEMVRAYWEIGREIVVDEQQGEKRAGYGEYLLKNLSRELTTRHGKGFDYSNLKNMRQFYLTYPIGDALRSQLSWTHYRLLMRHDDPQKRSFYEIESATNNWSTHPLAFCSVIRKARRWYALLYRKVTTRYLPHGTSCTCLPSRNWPPSCTVNVRHWSWNEA